MATMGAPFLRNEESEGEEDRGDLVAAAVEAEVEGLDLLVVPCDKVCLFEWGDSTLVGTGVIFCLGFGSFALSRASVRL